MKWFLGCKIENTVYPYLAMSTVHWSC